MKKIMVTGACGQIGTDLVLQLRQRYGDENIVATGYRSRPSPHLRSHGPFKYLNVLSKPHIEQIIFENDIDTIFHLAAVLSAVGEKNPQLAYNVNNQGLYNILESARLYNVQTVIWPSSIAVFGPDTSPLNMSNNARMRPTTMYGITKVTGELLMEYYHRVFGLDTRGVRFPGIISSNALPGGGTTDYAVEMYYAAVGNKKYTCFVRADTVLPMMYMPDAVKALIDLAVADPARLRHRIYNLAAMSFSAEQLADAIAEVIPGFKVDYLPDFRQEIADTWPRSLDDSLARSDWGWKHEYDLRSMTSDMIIRLRKKLKKIG
ncbi:MAG: NAD-dependent epimerase/dehydratase family protein [Candidatus Ranarchaeia archaeon]